MNYERRLAMALSENNCYTSHGMVMSIAFHHYCILPPLVIASVAKQSRHRRRPGLLHCVRNDGEIQCTKIFRVKYILLFVNVLYLCQMALSEGVHIHRKDCFPNPYSPWEIHRLAL
jgi:hypothetical protein